VSYHLGASCVRISSGVGRALGQPAAKPILASVRRGGCAAGGSWVTPADYLPSEPSKAGPGASIRLDSCSLMDFAPLRALQAGTASSSGRVPSTFGPGVVVERLGASPFGPDEQLVQAKNERPPACCRPSRKPIAQCRAFSRFARSAHRAAAQRLPATRPRPQLAALICGRPGRFVIINVDRSAHQSVTGRAFVGT